MRSLTLVIALCAVACSSAEDGDGDGYAADVDCDDSNASVHPEAAESCNQVDDNCDGTVDNDPVDGVTWLADEDGDGFGAEYSACTMPAEITLATKGGDCRDDVVDAYPGSRKTEVPNDGIDNDCDGNDFCTDLNCDGLPDVVTPSHHDGDYSITQGARLLSGSGGWALDPAPTDMNGTLGVTVADFNNDGYPDIVHASFASGAPAVVNTSSFVYWGPEHKMGNRTALPTKGAHWACSGDIDNNGYTDVIFANNNDGAIHDIDSYIYWNRAGAFSPTDRLALPTRGATFCTVADLDDDTYPDVIFVNFSSAGVVALDSYVYWGSKTGQLSADNRLALPTIGARTVTVIDVDKDGRKDLVFWAHTDGVDHIQANTFIYWNRAGGFSPTDRTALEGMGGYRGAVEDVNNDGHMDIVVPGYYAGVWTTPATSYVYFGNATNTYSNAGRASLSVNGSLDVVVDDINNDGNKDLLFGSHYNGTSQTPSVIFWGTAGGTFNNANRTELVGYQVTMGLGVADFDHDGFKDVFLPGYHNNATGMDPTPWANPAYSRIYWGSATGFKQTFFDQWMTRGAWDAQIVGK